MFEFDFAERLRAELPTHEVVDDFEDVGAVHLVHWEEHCLECAPPSCFETCPLFERRADQLCARFKNGIMPLKNVPGLVGYSADLTYKRWGKLECKLDGFAISPRALRAITRLDMAAGNATRLIGRVLNPVTRKRKVNTHIVYAKIRHWALQAILRARGTSLDHYDTFLVDIVNPADEPVTMILEVERDRIEARRSLILQPGGNRFELDASTFSPENPSITGRSTVPASMRLYPEADKEARLIVRALHFVRSRERAGRTVEDGLVKCVTWDLDNTLWDGTLVETDGESLDLRPGVLETLVSLDQRGVLQSISSKNDHDHAWPVLERLGVADYFLYPAINWQPKSTNIARIAERLNIGLDSFVHIDDSDVERSEVSRNLPQVRVVDEHQVPSLPSFPGVPDSVTAESQRRRLLYQEEALRRIDASDFGDDHVTFLRSCGLVATIGPPTSPESRTRCLELLLRTNQLNISKRDFDEEQLAAALESTSDLVEAVWCTDEYGNYGLVGLVIVRIDGPEPLVTDFVLSCRVAKKFVEPALFFNLRSRLVAPGQSLQLRFRPSERNGALFDVLTDIGFAVLEQTDDEMLLALDEATPVEFADVVDVVETPGA